MRPNALVRRERTLEWAHAFLEEVRRDLERAAREGSDLPPRLRSVHERPGHATPEYRTLAIPIPDGVAGASPEVLSGLIARFARPRAPSCLLLVLDAAMEAEDGDPGSVLIAEARDRAGARFYLVQPYRREEDGIVWEEPIEGGWREPGDEEMILDAAFAG